MCPMLNVAVRTAHKAGTVINRASFDVDSLCTKHKQHNDFITEVDRAAGAAIIEIIKTAYPDHATLAEESGQSWAGGETTSENVWVIDPLDSTTSFIHGFPQYDVPIALMQYGIVTQAVMYGPTRGGLFTASKGAGVLLNNRHIRVTRRDKLASCLIGTDFPYRDPEDLYDYTRLFTVMAENCTDLRRPGTAALDLAYVAYGRLDGSFGQDLSKWDMATGPLLVVESGGLMGSYTSESGYLDQGEILAGNPRVFVQMIKFTSPFSRSRAEA